MISKWHNFQKVEWCKRCVISNQRPRIKFDDEGICAACNNRNSRHGIDWEARHIELMKLLQSHRNSNGSWDVVVPSSGGKTRYVAHQLKYKYGMNPL